MQKIKDGEIRDWYAAQTIEYGWSRAILQTQIDLDLYKRQGSNLEKTSNFKTHLPSPQSDLAHQSLKDPYIFDFLTVGKNAKERELEKELTTHITKFLLELGTGFSFVGRQVPEYALRNVSSPIGVSEYQLTRMMPKNLKTSLPTIEEIEEELSADLTKIKK